jgi:hypothetical protein
MCPAQWDSEFVAHFSAERPRLHEAKMVGIGWLSSTYEARLLGDKPKMLLVSARPRRSSGFQTFDELESWLTKAVFQPLLIQVAAVVSLRDLLLGEGK